MKPDYDVELIKPYIAKLDMVLPMSVFPGFSRQSYIQGTEAKVARIVEMAREAGVSPLIEVDGGLKANDPTRAVCAARLATCLLRAAACSARPIARLRLRK